MLSGPFVDAAVLPMRARAPRDWENGETFGDGWGANAPINVGKRARNKDRARMERRALELEEEEQDDEGDWFANAQNMRNRGVRGGPGPDAGGQRGFRKKDAKIRLTRAWKSDDPPSSPSNRKQSLLERVGNDDDHGHHSHSRDHHHGHYGRDRDRDRDRDKDRGRERGGWERSRDRDNDQDWDRGRDRGQDYGGGLSVRGSASRNDSSRHTGLEAGELREGRRREDSRTRSSRDRDRDRERERESRMSRDRGPRGPQYKGGYTR
jgi:protein AIR1/2